MFDRQGLAGPQPRWTWQLRTVFCRSTQVAAFVASMQRASSSSSLSRSGGIRMEIPFKRK